MGPEGAAAHQPSCREGQAPPEAVDGEGLDGVVRAARVEAAGRDPPRRDVYAGARGQQGKRLARHADKFALVRSVSFNPKGLTNHGAAIYTLLTGHDPTNFTPTGLAVPPSRDDLPAVGAAVARYRPSEAGALSYVAVCGPVKENVFIGVAQSAGLLGNAYDPYTMYDDPAAPPRAAEFTLPPDVTLGRLRARLALRAAARARDELGPRDFNTFYGKAFSLIESARAARSKSRQTE